MNRAQSRKLLIVIHDMGMVMGAWLLAWGIRFNFHFNFPDWQLCLYTLPVIVIIQSLISSFFGLYKGMWRFASMSDLWNIFRAAIVGVLSIMIVMFFINRMVGIPRTVLLMYPFFLMFLLGCPRLGYRLWKDNTYNLKTVSSGERVLIIGAGRAGEMLVRDMFRNDNYSPIGFLDDNPKLENSELHGVPVLGPVNMIKEYAEGPDAVDKVIIAIPSATTSQMKNIVDECTKTDIEAITLPNINYLPSTSPVESELHKMSIEDLLGRDKVELDWEDIQKGITNQSIFVTGGGGSIGAELCRQIAKLGPKNLIIYEMNEFNLYKINAELTQLFPKIKLHSILGDIRDKSNLEHIFEKFNPAIIFHAAAYKHVPILEKYTREAVLNNVFGTINVAETAIKYECNKFILISSDKAVNPVNVLGKSKRLAEIVCEWFNSISDTQFITVRFGNVMGSDGSVIPLFKEQIINGGPVTITHPDITRYFMTVTEASQLILQAGAMGNGGEIFVLNMGEPVKISYLAEHMIKLSNLVPNKDINIEYIGLRPGEKLYEELFYGEEIQEETEHKKILLAKHFSVHLNSLRKDLDELEDACSVFDDKKTNTLLDKYTIQNMFSVKPSDKISKINSNG